MLLFSELKKRNLLSNESMSNVHGGVGTCGYRSSRGVKCHVSKDEALAGAGADGHWCCDSCATSTYCRETGFLDAAEVDAERPKMPFDDLPNVILL